MEKIACSLCCLEEKLLCAFWQAAIVILEELKIFYVYIHSNLKFCSSIVELSRIAS